LDDGSRFIRRYVEDDEADFGIGKAPDNGRDFEITPLFQDFFVALVPSGHPLAGRKQIRFAELARFPFIRLKSSEGMISDLNKAVEKSGAVLNPVFELTHYYSIGRMVQAGFGITAMPQMALPMVNLTGLVAIPIVAPHVIREITIIRRKGAELSPSAQKFLSILMEVASEVGGKN
jgi:DNA-binding transcriptional LysR family regulator